MSANRSNIAWHLHNMIGAPAGVAVQKTIFKSEDGKLIAYGTTVPTDAATGYAEGCIFIKTDGSAGAQIYINEGSDTSCDFKPLASNNRAASAAGGTGPSPLIWDGIDFEGIKRDPSRGAAYYNDFLEVNAVSTNPWTITTVNSGTIHETVAEVGGVINFDSTGHNAADDGINAQLLGFTVKPAAGVTIAFECRAKMQDTGNDQYFMGLVAPAMTATMVAGVMDDTVDKAGFHREQGSTADKISSITAKTTAEDETADVATIADNTYYNFGFVIDGLTSITFYVDGVVVETGVTTANIPNAVLVPTFVAQIEQTSVDAELEVDWMKICQVGGRT